jgi:phage-related protein
LDDLRAFPDALRRGAGYQPDRVQRGLDPGDWKPMARVGSGAREIWLRDQTGAFRVICVAALADAVYVLHALQKKTQQTAKSDLDLAASRYRQLGGRRGG